VSGVKDRKTSLSWSLRYDMWVSCTRVLYRSAWAGHGFLSWRQRLRW